MSLTAVPHFRNPEHFQHFALSERHRMWGFNLPCLDLDFLLTEYNTCQPVGLADYKFAEQTVHYVEKTHGIRTLCNLARLASLPAWIAFYRTNSWTVQVWPLNDLARAIFGEERINLFIEADYVELLYQMRGLPMPESVAAACNQTGNRIRGTATTARRLVRKKVRPIVVSLCHPKHKAQH